VGSKKIPSRLKKEESARKPVTYHVKRKKPPDEKSPALMKKQCATQRKEKLRASFKV